MKKFKKSSTYKPWLSKEDISENIKKGMEAARQNGAYIGRPPRFCHRVVEGGLELNPYVRFFVKNYWPVRNVYWTRSEIEPILWKWYRDVFPDDDEKPYLKPDDVFHIRKNSIYGELADAKDHRPYSEMDRRERHLAMFPGRDIPDDL